MAVRRTDGGGGMGQLGLPDENATGAGSVAPGENDVAPTFDVVLSLNSE